MCVVLRHVPCRRNSKKETQERIELDILQEPQGDQRDRNSEQDVSVERLGSVRLVVVSTAAVL